MSALSDYLNELSSKDNEIDAVFVFNGKNGTLAYKSTTAGASGQISLDDVSIWLNRLKGTGQLLSSLKFGELQYALFPFSKGMINLYFEDKGFPVPLIIGFVSLNGEDKMGTMLFHSGIAVLKIREMLKKEL